MWFSLLFSLFYSNSLVINIYHKEYIRVLFLFINTIINHLCWWDKNEIIVLIRRMKETIKKINNKRKNKERWHNRNYRRNIRNYPILLYTLSSKFNIFVDLSQKVTEGAKTFKKFFFAPQIKQGGPRFLPIFTHFLGSPQKWWRLWKLNRVRTLKAETANFW